MFISKGLQQEKIKGKEVKTGKINEETEKKETLESPKKLLASRENEAKKREEEGKERVEEDVESSPRHETRFFPHCRQERGKRSNLVDGETFPGQRASFAQKGILKRT